VGGGPAEATTTQPGRERGVVDDLDTQTFEALYYRARLILGEPLPRPARFRLGRHPHLHGSRRLGGGPPR
jgi:hypothetical protein